MHSEQKVKNLLKDRLLFVLPPELQVKRVISYQQPVPWWPRLPLLPHAAVYECC